MLRAVIVDDEQPAIDLLKILLENTGRVQCVGEYSKPSEAVKRITALDADVIFLDVEMPGTNGLELASKLLDQVSNLKVVFVTAFRDYAVEAFALDAVDYLLKPTLPENVERAVGRLLEQRQQRWAVSNSKAQAKITGFGKLEVKHLASGELVKWRTAKVEELFAYLLYYRGTIVRKGEILEALWPECDQKSADSNLHTSVYKLKKTLKEINIPISIKFAGGGYFLEVPATVDYDIAEFEAFASSSRVLDATDIGEYEKMVALYKGDYLEGKEYLWCMAERVRLQKYFSDLAKQMTRYYMKTGQYLKAEQILLKNIGYIPYDEDAHELLLKLCALRGDRPALIRYYDTLQTILQGDLGIEPRPSLKRLYEGLMNTMENE